MIVGIVSDTHGRVELTRPAVRMLESLDVEVVLHCGDIGSLEIIDCFERWPTHFVLGNVDDDARMIEAAVTAAGQHFHGRFATIDLAEKRIAMLHGDDDRLLRETIASGQFDLVCYGHTHRAQQHIAGRTLVVNPGALFRAQPHTLAIARLPEMTVTHVTV